MSERGLPPHDADGWAQSVAYSDFDCPRCGERVHEGELVVASGYAGERTERWVCRRHSNIEADRERVRAGEEDGGDG